MTRYPLIINNFISDEKLIAMDKFLSPLAVESPHNKNLKGALGYPNSNIASKVGYSIPAMPGYENTNNSELVGDIGQLLVSIKMAVEKEFEEPMDTVQFIYQQLFEGANNPLHSDNSMLDGKPLSEDGFPDEVQWSALLYLNSKGEEFDGGDLVFPNQGLRYSPKRGDLVMFKGDYHHPHKVELVTRGIRTTFVCFFGASGVTSDRSVFGN